MTTLVHDAVMLEVPVDTVRLFHGDELYTLWAAHLVDRVAETRMAQARSAQRYAADDDG